MIGSVLKMIFGGGVIKQFTDPLVDAYRAKLEATNDSDRLEAEVAIQRLEGMQQIAVLEAQDRWSATRIGRLLIVVPFGIWWTGIYAVSVINPLFGVNFVIFDVPSRIFDMSLVLVPAIVVADSGLFRRVTSMVRR